jgi:hypothetical protein
MFAAFRGCAVLVIGLGFGLFVIGNIVASLGNGAPWKGGASRKEKYFTLAGVVMSISGVGIMLGFAIMWLA